MRFKPRPKHQAGVNHMNLANLVMVDEGKPLPDVRADCLTIRLDACLLNARSIKNKVNDIVDYTVDHKLDLFFLTETWLGHTARDQTIIGDVCPSGYSLLHTPRTTRVGILYRSALNIKQLDRVCEPSSYEYLECCLTSDSGLYRILLVYRSPTTSSTSAFLEEFADHLDETVYSGGNLIVLGDFNFHVDDSSNLDATKFTDLIESYNIVQHVSVSTHMKGHTLDLLMSRSDEACISNLSVSQGVFSDHFPVHFQLPCSKPPLQRRTISYRRYRQMDKAAFQNNVVHSASAFHNCNSIASQLEFYNNLLTDLIDKHAPARSFTIVERPNPPWYNVEILAAKRGRRAAERRWHSSGLQIHQDIFRDKRLHVNKLIDRAKQLYLQRKISSNKGDSKTLFKTIRSLLYQNKRVILPRHDSSQRLATRFAAFFTQKITRIHAELAQSLEPGIQPLATLGSQCSLPENHSLQELCSFIPATSDEIRKLIMKSPSASCCLDPIPTWLLKENLDSLLPILTQVVNTSLSSGTVPKAMKQAVISPLLKKGNLNPEDLKHFRPVSNLSFVSKLMERVVASRLEQHMHHQKLYEPLQSAYRKGHSTETALIKIMDDLLRAMDRKECILVVLLDQSAAFDTVSHTILLHRLHARLGLSGSALAWFTSYLQGRTQTVRINGSVSPAQDLEFGVPQGSVLGPLLFSIYTLPLGDIIRKHSIRYHFYADDTQLYLTFPPLSSAQAVSDLEKCIAEVRSWLSDNLLRLNDTKTQFLVIGSRDQLALTSINSLTIGDTVIPAVHSARNLGFILESSCSVRSHVKAVCQSARYHLRNIGRIRRYLDPDRYSEACGSCTSDVAAGQPKCPTPWCFGSHCLGCPASSECCGQDGGRSSEAGLHYSCPSVATLASCCIQMPVQDLGADLQGSALPAPPPLYH